MRRRVVIGLVLAVLVLLPGTVRAQQDAFALTAVNFNFQNPGARARGIGGAFVALADDATASLANPAGVAFLDRQFSLELAYDEEEFPVGQLTHGEVQESVSGTDLVFTPTGDPFQPRSDSESTRLNYASVTLPIRSPGFTVALYYAALADLDTEFGMGQSLGCVDATGNAFVPGGGEPCTYDLTGSDLSGFVLFAPQNVAVRLQTDLIGAAAGVRLSDRWAVGLSLAMAQTELVGTGDILGEQLGLPNVSQQLTVDDDDLMYSAGLLHRGEHIGFGVSYRSESTHAALGRIRDEQGEPLEGFIDPQGELTVPDRLAVGFAFLPTDNWVIAAEVDRIGYSDLLSGMDLAFEPFVSALGIDYRVEDVTEYHLGMEYTTFRDRRGWSLRGGWWRDTTHLPYVDEDVSAPLETIEEQQLALQSLLRRRTEEDVDHFTLGGGFATGRIRVDAAVDHSSDAGTDFLLSGVVYF